MDNTLPRRGIRGFIFGHISSKIIGPYLVLTFVLAVLATYIVLRLISNSLEQRFTNQLLDAGRAVNDAVLKVESEQLEVVRLMSNTEGVDAAVQKSDTTTLAKLLAPIALNSAYRYVDVFDASGREILVLRPNEDAKSAQVVDPHASDWSVTKFAVAGKGDSLGDKYSELVLTSFGPMLYSGGPILDAQQRPVGAVLVGVPFNDLLKRLTKDVLASVTFYAQDGSVIGSTLPQGSSISSINSVTYRQATTSRSQVERRYITVGGQPYLELIGSLVVRDHVAAAVGVSLPTSLIVESGDRTRNQLLLLFSVVICGVLLIGLILARSIAKPVRQLVEACLAIARGDFNQVIQVKSQDEMGVLATTFNKMVVGLKERDFIRDTFGRFVTKQVSDAVLSGQLKLGGENRDVTVLMSDIRGFTPMSEKMEPEQLVTYLNRYFGRMIDVIQKHEGTLDKFMGDAIMVVFGAPIAQVDHARRAVLTALAMRDALKSFNEEVAATGLPAIRIGIGINSGSVIAGNIGSEQRMEYTVIGDMVNTTQRVEDLTKNMSCDILVSASTYSQLPPGEFEVGEPRLATLRGRSKEVAIYPLLGVTREHESLLGSTPADDEPAEATPTLPVAVK